MFFLINKIKNSLVWHFFHYFFVFYQPYVKYKGWKIRKKSQIKVLFVIAEVGAWKTEELFLAMRNHNRFLPLIGITESQEVHGSKKPLIEYLESRNYEYVDLDTSKHSIDDIHPDILFYYKPYDTSYPKEHVFKYHLSSIVCHIMYSFNTVSYNAFYNNEICDYAWYCFVENEMVVEDKKKTIGWRAHNLVITGIPMQDKLLQPASHFNDPWKDTKGRKRIIYSPHHSFPGTNGGVVEYGSFLIFGDYMLELAKKFQKEVYFLFNPHPTLYPKLLKIWGKEKTDKYYNAWNELENGQLGLGEYVGRFKHSDAMVHDCVSFRVEYHYTKNPVMYLLVKELDTSNLNDFGKKAFEMHYKGRTKEDIEQFVKNVINNVDPMKNERERFYRKCLLPPYGRSASENIINKILG